MAQKDVHTQTDSVTTLPSFESIDVQSIAGQIDTSSIKMKPQFKPNPKKAVIYSAIFPGLGHIYNRKYWKLPLVYGAYLGCAYAISWNGNQYNGYRKAYRDISDKDPDTNSWINYQRGGNPNPYEWTESDKVNLKERLKRGKDIYRRYRDLSYIVTVGVYALTMIDAYVDAQLFNFDISQDLSMQVEPVVFDKSTFNSRSFGLQCSFKF